MAAAHLEALRTIQPQGPYLLGGWCNGGLIAYEIARQLQAQGQRVDLLILMDSDPAVSRWNRTHRLISEAGSLLRLAPKMQVDLFLWYRHLRLSFYYWRLNKGKQTKQVQAEFEQNEGMLRRDWPALYDWVYSGYMPYSYAGKITLFWTDEEPHRSRKWQQVMEGHVQGEVEMHIIPGNHISSRTQYLSVLAEKLSLCLSKVQTNILSNIS